VAQMEPARGGRQNAVAAGPPRLGSASPPYRTRVKICGCTSAADVAVAVAAGADAVGVIFAPSPRRISPEMAATATAAVPSQVSVVGVFVDPTPAELEHAAKLLPRLTPQFSGSEPPWLCRHLGLPYLKVFSVADEDSQSAAKLALDLANYPDALPIFETASRQRGGSGRTFAWSVVQPLVRERAAVISGGLSPANVGECVRQLRPYAVDVRTGVESFDRKDPAKVEAFINTVRSADATS
jgi:phosphoribosylanthranilate isomerase